MKARAAFVLVFLFILGSKAQTASDLTIVFKGQAKVNALKSDRNARKMRILYILMAVVL